jgi:hypothetical protein
MSAILEQRERATIRGPVVFTNALGKRTVLRPGPCELGASPKTRHLRVYLTIDGTEFNYDFADSYIRDGIERQNLVPDNPSMPVAGAWLQKPKKLFAQ